MRAKCAVDARMRDAPENVKKTDARCPSWLIKKEAENRAFGHARRASANARFFGRHPYSSGPDARYARAREWQPSLRRPWLERCPALLAQSRARSDALGWQ